VVISTSGAGVEATTAEDSAGDDPAGIWLGPAGVEASMVLAAVRTSALGGTAGDVAWVREDATAELRTTAGAELSITGDEVKGAEAEGTPH